MGDYAWWNGNADNVEEEYAHSVGAKKPNAWGLYDMHGNVWEWCQDWCRGEYPSGSAIDPKGHSLGSDRVNRGGGWRNIARFCRSANRFNNSQGDRSYRLGFRLSRTQ